MIVLFANCNVLDTGRGELLPDYHVLVEGDLIKEVSDRPITAPDAVVCNVAGRTLMPGLCDAHVHVTATESDLPALERLSPSYLTARSLKVLSGMLRRGFTTVRDAGGADWGLAEAVSQGICEGPRLLFSGHALSQTGGHGDMRSRGEDSRSSTCPVIGFIGRVCDGVSGARLAARDELRKGAHQIKIMASGGVASPTDSVTDTQFSLEEIRAIVEEAEAANTYVMSHAYTARSIRRALNCGVRSIEHGNLIDDETLDLLTGKGAFLVPTLATYEMISREGVKAGLPESIMRKIGDLRERSLVSLEMAYRKGSKIAFGTDLLGPFHPHQSLEFSLRREVVAPADIIRSATVTCSELFNLEGKIGAVAPGAYADLLVVDGNPLENLGLLQEQGRYLSIVMKGGEFVINRLPL